MIDNYLEDVRKIVNKCGYMLKVKKNDIDNNLVITYEYNRIRIDKDNIFRVCKQK